MYLAKLEVYIVVGDFITSIPYVHTSRALANLRICADLPEPSSCSKCKWNQNSICWLIHINGFLRQILSQGP